MKHSIATYETLPSNTWNITMQQRPDIWNIAYATWNASYAL